MAAAVDIQSDSRVPAAHRERPGAWSSSWLELISTATPLGPACTGSERDKVADRRPTRGGVMSIERVPADRGAVLSDFWRGLKHVWPLELS